MGYSPWCCKELDTMFRATNTHIDTSWHVSQVLQVSVLKPREISCFAQDHSVSWLQSWDWNLEREAWPDNKAVIAAMAA